jgi:hypothetical protein
MFYGLVSARSHRCFESTGLQLSEVGVLRSLGQQFKHIEEFFLVELDQLTKLSGTGLLLVCSSVINSFASD